MQKIRRIKFEDEYNKRLKAAHIPLFGDADEAGEYAKNEAEAAGVSPGAVMHVSEEGAVTGVYAAEKSAGIIDAVYEPGDVISDPEAFSEESKKDTPLEGEGGSLDDSGDDEDEDDESEEAQDEFSGLNVEELKDKARDAEITGFSTMKKDELLEALRK